MKVYQLIYTAVQHCLSDPALGLSNEPGFRVYSCSQGLTKEEIEEIVRYCGYRLPKNFQGEYSQTPADPKVPEQFPKTFRAFALSAEKTVVLQSVYSGVDWNGNPGNFFAHAFIFEDAGPEFSPEDYYGSPDFQTCLTEKQIKAQLVKYLPVKEEVAKNPELEKRILGFIEKHKKKVFLLLEKAIEILRGGEKTHLCVAASQEGESDFYLLSLKYLLPPDAAREGGISTYNVYLPSDKQKRIIFHGTVKGKNNITEESVKLRENCIYLDMDTLKEEEIQPIKLFEFSSEELHKLYHTYSIRTAEQLDLWCASYERIGEPGAGERLLELKEKVSSGLFLNRCRDILSMLDDPQMDQVRFELLQVMYDNLKLFDEGREDITRKYVREGVSCICGGESQNLENLFKDFEDAKSQAALVYSGLAEYMALIEQGNPDEKKGMLLLRLFALIKQTSGIGSWREFFKDNPVFLSQFVELAALVMINDTAPVTFTAPVNWSKDELSEVVAYFDSSTQDKAVKIGCRKYIINNAKEDWSRFGITLTKAAKPREEREQDVMRIRKMLSTVGYVPYQGRSYKELKFEVTNDMSINENPLLLTRLLHAVYTWQGTSGQLPEAQKAAQKAAELILELKNNQRSCYDFIFPKLALEILSTKGHYHELLINTETMIPTFWNWFLIGYKKNEKNEEVMLTYQQVFEANDKKLAGYPMYPKLRQMFRLR